MAKRTTVLTTFSNLTAAPANSVFPVDGDWGEILVELKEFTGTAPTLTTAVVQVDKTLVLPYDGQTANYTVGKRVRGSTSNATGLLVDDTDNLGPIAATSILTLGANAGDGDVVTLDSKVYAFQATLTDVDGNVHIGATASDTIDNLVAAINLDGPGLPDYADLMTLHPTVSAAAGPGDTMDVTAKTAGTAGNSIVSTTDIATSSFTETTLDGGEADAGATGTLTLKGVVGKFKNNETLTEEFGDGVALVNSSSGGTVTYVELGTWATTGAVSAGASVTREILIDPDGVDDARPVVPGLYRLKFTAGGGVITELDGNVSFSTIL